MNDTLLTVLTVAWWLLPPITLVIALESYKLARWAYDDVRELQHRLTRRRRELADAADDFSPPAA